MAGGSLIRSLRVTNSNVVGTNGQCALLFQHDIFHADLPLKRVLIGVSCCSPLEILMHHLMTPCLCTSIMRSPRNHRKDGTHVPNLLWLYPTLMIQLSTLLAVSLSHSLPTELYSYTVLSDANHRFITEECDWGFTRFSELRKLFNTQEGNSRPTIEEESAEITVFVRVLEDPTGVLWHNFVKCACFILEWTRTDRVSATTPRKRLGLSA